MAHFAKKEKIMKNNESNINSNAIKIIDNAINNCSTIINWLESQDDWKKSSTVGSTMEKKRTSSTIFVPFLSYKNPSFIYDMNKIVWEQLDIYAKDWDFSFNSIENVSIQRYEIDQYYSLHSDAPGNVGYRIVSALVYLNTVDEGGETNFPYANQKIKPVEGRLAIFPSNYVYAHEALAPVSGVKYAAAFWAIS